MLNNIIDVLAKEHKIKVVCVWSDGFVRPSIERKLINGVLYGFDFEHFCKSLRNAVTRKIILFEDFIFKYSDIATLLLTIQDFVYKVSNGNKKNVSKAVFYSDEQNIELFKMLISGWKELKEYNGENKELVNFFGECLNVLHTIYYFFQCSDPLNKNEFLSKIEKTKKSFDFYLKLNKKNQYKRMNSKVYGFSFVLISQINHTFSTLEN